MEKYYHLKLAIKAADSDSGDLAELGIEEYLRQLIEAGSLSSSPLELTEVNGLSWSRRDGWSGKLAK